MATDVKRCPRCEDTLPAASFYRNTTQRDRLSSYCKGCCVVRAAVWRRANPRKNREHQRAYYAANADKVREQGAAYCAANPDKVRARWAAWKKANPAARAASWARRNARKLNAPGRGVAASQWREVLTESLGICAYCNERKLLTMDHIEPLSLGGEHDVENIVAACMSCNASKRDVRLLVWLARAA